MVLRNFEQWRSIVKEACNASKMLLKFFCCLHITETYVVDITYLIGPSMLPTVSCSGEIVLADRLSHRFGKIVPGNIVLVRSPEVPRKIIAKRLIAMEGDSVTYLIDPKNSERCETVVVPKGHVWIQGDNIYESRDSRTFGPVPYGLIHGKIFWRVHPVKDFGPL